MKHIVLSILSVVSAPVLYGVICLPLLGWLVGRNTPLLNEFGGTFDTGLTLQIIVVQFVIILLTGVVVVALAPSRRWIHLAASVALMMLIAIVVQASSWETMLVWYHFAFFACILLAMPAGALLLNKVRPEQPAGQS